MPEPVIGSEYAWPSPYRSRGRTRSAMSVGVFFSCWMPASCSRFRRSSSAGANAGIQDHVGVDGERLVEIFLERGQADDREVEIRARRQVGAEAARARR